MHDEDLDLGHIIGAGLTLTATALLPRQSTPLLLETAPEYSPALRLKRLGKSNLRWSYNKITKVAAGKKLVEQFHKLKENDINFLVYNFVDMLSHARTEMEVIRELADDESAYRSLTISWLEHSPLLDVIKKASEEKMNLVITTDHGTIKVDQPVKIAGERNTNTNLRYKVGRGLGYKSKDTNPPCQTKGSKIMFYKCFLISKAQFL